MTADSDVDVAVYFRPDAPGVEIEAETTYPDEDDVWSDLERICRRPVDLVVLNRAPVALAEAVFHDGAPLVCRDPAEYWRYFLPVTRLAEEYREFVSDYVAIRARSHSLSQRDRARLLRIVDFANSEIKDGASFASLTRERYLGEPATRRNVERLVENLVNAAIDTAKILLAARDMPVPETYRDTLRNLSVLEGFPAEAAERLASFAKLRSLLAHEYLELRWPEIRRFVDEHAAPYAQLLSRARQEHEIP